MPSMSTELNIRIGPFALSDKLGSGGMAEVYRARHEELGQDVAIKVMTHERAIFPRFHADFRREVQAAARLNHPSIVRVFDYGVIEDAVDGFVQGSPYLVMEIADRGSLDRTKLLSWGTVRRVILQLLDALAYAHARDLIHRDVKPANLLLASVPDGRVRVKLADFGIAHLDPNEAAERDDGRAVGTFSYAPPEQLHGEWRRYGPATDLYAVGCLVWQLVTGKPPFRGRSATQIAMRQMVAPLPEFEPELDVPPGLVDWLRRMLEKQPTDRYQRAADAALAFTELGGPMVDTFELSQSDALLPPDATTGTVDFGRQTFNYPDTVVVALGHRNEPLSRVSSGGLASADALALSPSTRMATAMSADDPRPKLPSTWRRTHIEYEPSAAGLGLGLFGLREIPFVGREGERDAIWHALRLVEDDEVCRAVVLRGASGAGKSRMAQWVCQRAGEVGCATVLRATHAAGRQQGLRDLVERALVTMGLEHHSEVMQRIVARLRELGVSDDDDFLEGEAVALAAIVRPDEAPRAGEGERIATVTRLLRAWSRYRQVILWLDDAQWDLESIALARHLAGQEDLPLMVLLTVQEEAAAELPEVDRVLDELLESEFAGQLEITPLDSDAQTELVRRLIGLDRTLCERVAAATRGNPLFAVHLVGDWVERGSLRPTPNGFVLRDGADTPSDLHALWVRRLDYVCGQFGGASQQAALEAAVALGGVVRLDEWEAVCAAGGLAVHDRLVPTLINLGMVIAEPTGWRFVHRLLAGSLERLSRDARRWGVLHGHCALALGKLYGAEDAVAERRAAHYLEAERWADALTPLAQAVAVRFASSDYLAAKELIGEYGRALEAAGIFDGRERAEHQLMLATLARRMQGETDIATLDQVIEAASANGWDDLLGRAEHERGAAASNAARLDEALDHYARAWSAYERAGATGEIAGLLQSRAWVSKAKGDTGAARQDLEAALDAHQASGDRMQELNTINSLAFTFLAAGDYDASRQVARMGIELGRELGHRGAEAGCWTTLGEIERFENRIDEARECYERAEELDALCGSKHVLLVRANAAMLDVATHDWERALQKFDVVEPAMVAQGHNWMEPFFTLARACCAAGRADWTSADELWVKATAAIDDAQLVERDVGWLADIMADVCVSGGQPALARRALEYALAQWSGLNDSQQVAATTARLDDL